jgi:hypothetical protein
MDPDPLASAETITLMRLFSPGDTNRLFGHYRGLIMCYRQTDKLLVDAYGIKVLYDAELKDYI